MFGDKKMKGITTTMVVTLLISTTIFSVLGTVDISKAQLITTNTEENPQNNVFGEEGELDQSQTKFSGSRSIYNVQFAQSFRTRVKKLTRVQLYLKFNQGGTGSDNVKVSIRAGGSTPDYEEITSFARDVNDIPKDFTWVEFDFQDVYVTEGELYYIVLNFYPPSDVSRIDWGYYTSDDGVEYEEGSAWEKSQTWTEHPDDDFCFKTYGIGNLRPDKPSLSGFYDRYVTPGYPLRFEYTINDPDNDKMRVHWYIGGEEVEEEDIWRDSGSHLGYQSFDSGTHLVKIRVEDEHGQWSYFSDTVVVHSVFGGNFIEMVYESIRIIYFYADIIGDIVGDVLDRIWPPDV